MVLEDEHRHFSSGGRIAPGDNLLPNEATEGTRLCPVSVNVAHPPTKRSPFAGYFARLSLNLLESPVCGMACWIFGPSRAITSFWPNPQKVAGPAAKAHRRHGFRRRNLICKGWGSAPPGGETIAGKANGMRIAILDDYTNAARTAADWSRLGEAQIETVNPSLMRDEEERIAALRPFDVVVAMRERTAFPAEMLAALDKLKLLVTTGMRNNSIDMEAARASGIDVCGTSMTPYAAFEHAWALILSVAKQIPAEAQAMRSGAWQQHTGVGLHGKTLGILGLGKLGGKVARVAHAFDMNVIAWSPNLTEERAAEHGATLVSKQTLFRDADFLTIHMVLSERSRGIVAAPELALMKPGAYLVNTSRGPLVDEEALLDALESKAIAGAGLDVFNIEPLPAEHRLRRLDNVVLTGHTGYVIREMYELAYGQALEDILAWMDGTPMRLLN